MMLPFDCLSSASTLLGSHLIEASAGTGKTFAIEHIFVRLLLEKEDLSIEEILVVTFTRAATRDLKARIRANLQKAENYLEKGEAPWEYLEKYIGSVSAKKKIKSSLQLFDQAQIFTIHGFCYRMLQEFALEANRPFSIPDPDGVQKSQEMKEKLKKWLENVSTEIVSIEQLSHLLKEYNTVNEIVDALLKAEPSRKYVDQLADFNALYEPWRKKVDEEKLLSDFALLEPCFKKTKKGNFIEQVIALAHGDFSTLVKEKGTLFSFLHRSNEKVRSKKPENLSLLPFWDFIQELAPLVKNSSDVKKILGSLKGAWMEKEDDHIDPDQMTLKMWESLQKKKFKELVQKKYQAAIVDEFQDTDPVQWQIIDHLFIERENPLSALYLVGDPKQSIYRFRKADVYTYFKAKEKLGLDAHFSLDTNFRSTPSLISSLNTLFSRNWLPLPKTGETIACPPVKPGQKECSIVDGKGSIHFVFSDEESFFLSYITHEIISLFDTTSFDKIAILVKDRYQGEMFRAHLQENGIPCLVRSLLPIGKTAAFQAIWEIFDAFCHPLDPHKKRLAELGPFSAFFSYENRRRVEENGLKVFFSEVIHFYLYEEWKQDLRKIMEEALLWEDRNGFSYPGICRFLKELSTMGIDEGAFRLIDGEKSGVQILTIHASKGLEYEVVFAPGLNLDKDEEEVESDAEKMRLLYVAATRAKKRVYFPSIQKKKKLSLINHFLEMIEKEEGDLHSFLEKGGMTYEEISFQPSKKWEEVFQEKEKRSISLPSIYPKLIQSFTSLAKPTFQELDVEMEKGISSHTIPRGQETGIIIHQIFEKLFSSKTALWKDNSAIENLVKEEIEHTSLLPWVEPIVEMIQKTVAQPLIGSFSLNQLEIDEIYPEMQFLYPDDSHYLNGFIDLVFVHKKKIYFVDWKTNWQGVDDAAYQNLESVMEKNDYFLQASLYREGLKRHVKRFYMDSFEEVFGGAFYLFVRGGGICHIK